MVILFLNVLCELICSTQVNGFNHSYLTLIIILLIICLHIVKRFQVFLFNITNSIYQVFLRKIIKAVYNWMLSYY